MLNEAATIRFDDQATKSEALVIVRYNDSTVTLALSHHYDGDILVAMSKEAARQLLKALTIAVEN